MAISYLTPEGYEKLRNELEHLKTKGREEKKYQQRLQRLETKEIFQKTQNTMLQKMLMVIWK